ncbi:unnamed protein product [Cyclocybe aegerita]|uniref:Yeast cell wall synthesis Kre9/Knh1-like N-terminal domain-containing protein n=1 Tax=Cyclocybe aegerita TaxID=1973307 RepID=A0A8S0XYP1_CYCAE|nr:unnamed protein product [Cyclocybe aegerita]
MYSSLMALALAIICLDFVMLVNAGLYIVEPRQGTTCRGGQPCTVTWLDDGTRPLLSAIGVSTIGLYTGKQQLVQRITPVDVSTAQSLTFTPNPAAGPNSDDYYISITSTTLKGNESIPYSGWSAWFSLTGMSGSFDTPLPAVTSSIPIPASLTQTSSAVTSTRTIGTPSTSLKPLTTPLSSKSASPSFSTSRLSTSTLPAASTTSASSAPSSSQSSLSSTNGATGRSAGLPLLSLVVASAFIMLFS